MLRSIPRRAGVLVAALAAIGADQAHAQDSKGPWTRGPWTLNAPQGEWWMTGRDYGLTRYSPLQQITTRNIAQLKAAWSFSTGTLRGHEGNPLVVGNVMYVHTSFPNIIYALDLAKPGAPQIWKHVPNQSPDAIPIACCDLVNRGTAYHPSGKIVIQLLQGELLALDAKTGQELWKVKHPESSGAGTEATGYKQGATMTNAPIVIKDIVIAGISGGEFGVRGRVSAGKVLWQFKTPSGIIGNPMTFQGPDKKQYVAVLSGIGGWAGIGVAAGIGAEDPTAGLGALGAFGDAGQFSNQGGVLTVFSLP
jgi:glucose dehydrogenase